MVSEGQIISTGVLESLVEAVLGLVEDILRILALLRALVGM